MATITPSGIKIVASKKGNAARKCMADLLGWEDFDESAEPIKGFTLDFLLDCMNFCISKGFPWYHVRKCVQLAYEALHLSKGLSLPEAVKLYMSKSEALAGDVSENSIMVFSEFFFQTFMVHYKLYQFVLTQEQEASNRKVEVEVETTPEQLPLSEAKDISVWEYEQKIAQIEQAHVARQKEREQQQSDKQAEAQSQVAESFSTLESLPSLPERDDLVNLINSIASAQINTVSQSMVFSIQNTAEDIAFKLEKTALPRPPALGAPPRYGAKTPVGNTKNRLQVASATRSRSKSRTSSRKSKK